MPIRSLVVKVCCCKWYAVGARLWSTYNVHAITALNERQSDLATVAGCFVDRTESLQSCEGTISNSCRWKLGVPTSDQEMAMKEWDRPIGGTPCRMLQVSEKRSMATWGRLLPMILPLQLQYLHTSSSWPSSSAGEMAMLVLQQSSGFGAQSSGCERRIDVQYQWSKVILQLVILRWNVNGIPRDVAVLETVLTSLLVEVAYIQENNLLPKDRTREVPNIALLDATVH